MFNAKMAKENVKKFNERVIENAKEKVELELQRVLKMLEEASLEGAETFRLTKNLPNMESKILEERLEELGFGVEKVNSFTYIIEW